MMAFILLWVIFHMPAPLASGRSMVCDWSTVQLYFYGLAGM
jgi:hypothetical protein